MLGRSYAHHAGVKPGYVHAPVEIGPTVLSDRTAWSKRAAALAGGVVVCAHTRVRGEVPDFAIVAGSPARTIGDVRTGDARLLEQYPELAEHYCTWAGERPTLPAESATEMRPHLCLLGDANSPIPALGAGDARAAGARLLVTARPSRSPDVEQRILPPVRRQTDWLLRGRGAPPCAIWRPTSCTRTTSPPTATWLRAAVAIPW